MRKFENLEIYETEDHPIGLSYSAWIESWCRWLLSFPRKRNPAFNNSRDRTNIEPPGYGRVIFLCQTIESVKPIPQRKIEIREGICIFMPVINWISINDMDSPTDEEMEMLARDKMDRVGKLNLLVNGKQVDLKLEDYRFRSGVFEMMMPDQNALGVPTGPYRLLSDGYWIFLKPGGSELTVSSFGSCSSGITEIGVDYHIRIAK